MKDNKICFLFPGQGAQYPGMAKDLWEASSQVKQLFALASDILGKDMTKLLFEGSDEDLKDTRNTQTAMTLASLSSSLFLKTRGIEAAGTAGFSLGEYAAYAEAEVLDTEEVFRMVEARGRIMSEAASDIIKVSGETGMAAVVGLDVVKATHLVLNSGIEDVYPANINSPVQLVISGTKKALSLIEPLLKEAGARRIVPLKVSGPFHSPLMKPAADKMADYLKDIDFKVPKINFYSNVSGSLENSPKRIKKLCLEHIISPVRWVDLEKAVVKQNYSSCLETGPGKVLTGLWKKSGLDISCLPAGTIDAIDQIIEGSSIC